MSDLIIHGGSPLSGAIIPSANKNAVLPILCATLLTGEPVTLNGVPPITDVVKIVDFFRLIGSKVDYDSERRILEIDHRDAAFDPQVHQLPVQMRSSIMLVPPLLARFGAARIENDVKGCTLGMREIDPHVEVIGLFGGAVAHTPDAIAVRADGRARGVRHWLDYASVTTTENFIMCAVLADGHSELTNAASEPHVQELCDFLLLLGARIGDVGSSRLSIDGVGALGGGEYTFAEDYHEIVTFLALSAITGGDVRVSNSVPRQFPLIDRTFAKFGVALEHRDGWSRASVDALRVRAPFTPNILQKVEAAPWPYVPVDLLPIFIALGVRASGSTLFWNKIYDGALGWVTELSKFGGHAFVCDPHRVVIFGGKPLTPAEVDSPYIIRVTIALLMLAASIPGRSVIRNALPIRRAHPEFVENLQRLGARISWSDES